MVSKKKYLLSPLILKGLKELIEITMIQQHVSYSKVEKINK